MKSIGLMQPRVLASIALLCAPPVVLSSVVRGQTTGELRGVVTDSSGLPVFGAIVELTGSAVKVRTNEQGEFRVGALPAGVVDFRVRRLGFIASSQRARVSAGQSSDELRIMLASVPTTVQPVVVQASHVEYTGRLAGYYERLHRRSNGTFISRDMIDRNNNKTLSQLISSMPGISAARLRGMGSAVRIRGMRCRPLVWLDGVPLPAGEVDLDAFPVNTLHGVEIYLGATNAPSDYTGLQGQSSCGTILLWSRGRDTEQHTPVQRNSIDLDALTDAHAVYTSDLVDTPARLAQHDLEVSYPADLVATRTTGSVIAEFVVSESGGIEPGSVEIVSSSHPLFAEAAIQALADARYTPAVKGGVAVRQLVQQPFRFSLGADTSSTGVRR